MAKRKFKTDLSVKGIEQLKKDLLNYRDNILRKNIEKYVQELLSIGVEVARTSVSESPLGKYVTISTNLSSDKAGCKGLLIAKGEVKYEVDKDGNAYPHFSAILAIEFGAGIYHNETPNPNADKFGLGVGTFPGQIHAFEDTWFYWDETSEKWKPTHGIRATMPMYNAQIEIMQQVVKVAKTIF